ncbi:MAG: tetratricopeptide repeat protein, partial [Thermodesulfovibrionia bacterium]
MALSRRHKHVNILLAVLTMGFVVFAVSNCNKEKTSRESPKESFVVGPIIDTDTGEKAPLNLKQMEKSAETPESLAILGDRYFESNRFQDAIDIYERVLKLNPDDVDTYNDLGLALHYIGKSDRAIDTLTRGTEVNPSFQRMWLSLGFVLTATGKNDEAKEALKKAFELDPNSEPGLEAK